MYLRTKIFVFLLYCLKYGIKCFYNKQVFAFKDTKLSPKQRTMLWVFCYVKSFLRSQSSLHLYINNVLQCSFEGNYVIRNCFLSTDRGRRDREDKKTSCWLVFKQIFSPFSWTAPHATCISQQLWCTSPVLF